MPPRMTTRSAGLSTAAPRGGGTGGRGGRGARRTREPVRRNNETIGELDGEGNDRDVEANGGVGRVADFSTIIAQQLQNLLPTLLAQVGSQGSDQGNGRNQNGDAVNDNIQGDVRNVLVSNDQRGCTYKEFLACNPKEYDGKGGAIVYTCWIEKMESVQDMSRCQDNQKVKYTARSFFGKALTWWNSQIHTRSREAAVGMSWEDFINLTREEFYPVNEMQKLETEFWNHAMVGAGHVAHTDRFHELARLVLHLVTPENKRIGRYIYGLPPQICGMVAATELTTIQKAMQKAGTLTDEAIRNGSLKKNTEKRGSDGEPSRDRNVKDDNKRSRTKNAFATTANLVEPSTKTRGSRPNQVVAIDGGQGCGNNSNRACGGAFMLGAEEARQDPNIVTGTFTLNNHYATTLFDSGADYSFVSIAFTPLLGIKTNNLGFSYEIEIASGQLVEINKVIIGCELEIEGHTFDIDLIPFGSGSFDVIVGMDWLSKHKSEIIFHGKTIRVVGERPEEKVRHLRSAKAKEQKKEDIVVV
ncbi:putative reverse transcriptase domain-containing protein [Tanacetum coccineum]|uniref:Reverse transcriptase domain-containing protein n=1 Tax=Tanacetum coccineum TaxID=301880 RepID=A0ABQ5CNF3_9ASTR